MAAVLIALAIGIAYSRNRTFAIRTTEATAVTASSAELHGLITPGPAFAAGWFEWGTSTELGLRSSVQAFQPGSESVAFSQSLRNLRPHTTYYFRAVGYHLSSTVRGEIRSFTTAGDGVSGPQLPMASPFAD